MFLFVSLCLFLLSLMVKCCCNTFPSCFFWLNGHNDSSNCVFLATISIGHRIPQPPSLCRCSAKLLHSPPLIRSSCHCSNDLVSALSLFYEIMMIYDRYIVRQMTWQRPLSSPSPIQLVTYSNLFVFLHQDEHKFFISRII